MQNDSERADRERLATLRAEHRRLDETIQALEAENLPDQIKISRLKKHKLSLKDAIASLEDRLFPDIIA